MQVMRSVIINAPIDTVWAVIRRFDGVANWNPGVTLAVMETGSATEVGSIRKLDIADGTIFRETLLAHSDIEHFYTYDIIDSPLPCRNYLSTHRLIEITDGRKTLGIWQGQFDCEPADADTLEQIVGDMIYLTAQRALDQFLLEQNL